MTECKHPTLFAIPGTRGRARQCGDCGATQVGRGPFKPPARILSDEAIENLRLGTQAPDRVVGADPALGAPYATSEAIRTEYQFVASPKYAGQWQIGGASGLRIAVLKKPRLLTRVLCKALLEWKWVDNVN